MSWPIRTETYGTLQWLRREVGGYSGYSHDQNTWTHEQRGMVDSAIQSGLMQFYFPPPLARGEGAPPTTPHQWTFLSPVAELALVSGTPDYALPGDFSGVVAEFTGGTAGSNRIPVVAEGALRQIQGGASQSGTPLYAAIRPRRSVGGAEQGWEVTFYPTPDAALTLKYRYTVAPQPLSDDNPYPLGGRQYAETILQSCLSVAEERLTKVAGGPATSRFVARLAAAIQLDVQSRQATGDGVWPLENAARGLIVNRAYLKRMIGEQLGYGPNLAAWTHKETQEVELALQTGLRKFYHPVPLLGMGEKYGHIWSFLRPVANLDLVSGKYRYDLPDDFALLDSPLTFAPGAAVLYPPVEVVGEHQIRQRLQRSEASARPSLAAVLPKPPDASGTRYELLVWPVPDQAYQLTYRYLLNPGSGSADAELPFGGQPHAQTLIEACLAAAEEQGGKPGLHSKLFLERLAASVAHDRLAGSPATLGYNRDLSDRAQDTFSNWHDCDENVVTYNGVTY